MDSVLKSILEIEKKTRGTYGRAEGEKWGWIWSKHILCMYKTLTQLKKKDLGKGANSFEMREKHEEN